MQWNWVTNKIIQGEYLNAAIALFVDNFHHTGDKFWFFKLIRMLFVFNEQAYQDAAQMQGSVPF